MPGRHSFSSSVLNIAVLFYSEEQRGALEVLNMHQVPLFFWQPNAPQINFSKWVDPILYPLSLSKNMVIPNKELF